MKDENLKDITVSKHIKYYTLDNDLNDELFTYFNPELGNLSRYIDISILEGITFSNSENYEYPKFQNSHFDDIKSIFENI